MIKLYEELARQQMIKASLNIIGAKGASKSKRVPNITGEKCERQGRGLLSYFLAGVESMVAKP